MKLASLRKGRDGELIVVNKSLSKAVKVTSIAKTLQQALDSWSQIKPELEFIYQRLNADSLSEAFLLNIKDLTAPLPRAYQWADGSAYVNHVELVRKARGAEMPPSFWTDPLIYQGASDHFIGPEEPMYLASEEWGIDFEAEVAVMTDDVPMGVTESEAEKHVQLLMLVNDFSLRNLIPAELAKGFGFFQSKPASSFSPVAVTPDELGSAWKNASVHLPLITYLNGKIFGSPHAGTDMTFNFSKLISHAAKTRSLGAGSIIGSGTVSNKDRSKGSSCLAEKRMLEILETGKPITPFMKFGDRVRIEMLDENQQTIFGAIDQEVREYKR